MQRDYEQLQEIVRTDAIAKSAPADDGQLAQDLNDARDHSAILKQQLVAKDAIIADLQQQLENLQTPAEQPSAGGSGGVGGGACSQCEALRTQLEAAQKKLGLATAAAASVEEGDGKEVCRM